MTSLCKILIFILLCLGYTSCDISTKSNIYTSDLIDLIISYDDKGSGVSELVVSTDMLVPVLDREPRTIKDTISMLSGITQNPQFKGWTSVDFQDYAIIRVESPLTTIGHSFGDQGLFKFCVSQDGVLFINVNQSLFKSLQSKIEDDHLVTIDFAEIAMSFVVTNDLKDDVTIGPMFDCFKDGTPLSRFDNKHFFSLSRRGETKLEMSKIFCSTLKFNSTAPIFSISLRN